MKEKKPNGGWGDRRDHELCLNFTLASNNNNNVASNSNNVRYLGDSQGQS